MAKSSKKIVSKGSSKPLVASSTVSFETFHEIGNYELMTLKKDTPSCFNGLVRFKKYKITIEEVEEPVEAYQDRLQKMWDECDNYHHWGPLKNAAISVGYKLQGNAGSKRVR